MSFDRFYSCYSNLLGLGNGENRTEKLAVENLESGMKEEDTRL